MIILKYILAVLFLATSQSFASEVIVDFEKKSLPVLNEELKRVDSELEVNEDDIATNKTNITSNDTDITANLFNSKVGTLTRDITAATADVVYTGVGFKPKLLIIFAAQVESDSASWGADNVTDTSIVMHRQGQDTSTYDIHTTLIRVETDATTGQDAIVKSFDTDGFTLTWTLRGSPSAGDIEVVYIAFF